jgi:hypothetical protein
MIEFKERRSNDVVSEERKEKILGHVRERLIKRVNEVIAKLFVSKWYDYDTINVKIENKIKLE